LVIKLEKFILWSEASEAFVYAAIERVYSSILLRSNKLILTLFFQLSYSDNLFIYYFNFYLFKTEPFFRNQNLLVHLVCEWMVECG